MRSETVDQTKEYRLLGVRLDGGGPFHRETKLGAQTAASKLSQVQAGDFIYSRLFAWRGAFGVINSHLDGCYVSGEFPTFRSIADVIDAEFLRLWFRLSTTIKAVEARCSGSTPLTRNRFKEHYFLAMEIPLPPLDEQRRIVARIEELAAKIEEARGLRREATGEAIALFSSAMNGVWKNQTGWKEKSLGELAATVSGQIDPRVEPYASLPHINGEAIESGTCKLLPYRLAKEDGVTSGKYHFGAGAVLYSKIRPYLRKAVQVPVEGICSADVYAFDSVDAALEPRFLMYSLVSPDFTSYANRLSGRTRMPKLNQKQLFVYKLRYPSRLEQKEFVSYLDRLQVKVDALKQAQAETAAELDALLPSLLDRAFSGEL
jgi:type I restriction enzyme S subunit